MHFKKENLFLTNHLKIILIISTLFLISSCGTDSEKTNSEIMLLDENNLPPEENAEEPNTINPILKTPTSQVKKSESAPVQMTKKQKEQADTVYKSCVVFTESYQCFFIDKDSPYGAKACQKEWTDKVRTAKTNLIKAGLYPQAEYKKTRDDFVNQRAICKKEARYPEGEYRCVRKHLFKLMHIFLTRFKCLEVLDPRNQHM